MDRAEKGLTAEQKAALESAVETAAKQNETFTTDDVWPLCPTVPRETRSMGPIMLSFKKKGTISATDRFIQCTRSSRNAAPIRVWKSNVWKQETVTPVAPAAN
jgi:hypothetical protein